MSKKDLDWSNLSFAYTKTDKRFVANFMTRYNDYAIMKPQSNRSYLWIKHFFMIFLMGCML